MLLKLFYHVLGQVYRYGKAYALCVLNYGGIYPYNFTVHVHQRATAVSRVDRCIGLDEVIVGSLTYHPAFGRNDPRCDSVAKAKGISYGENPLTYLELIRITKLHHRQIFSLGINF